MAPPVKKPLGGGKTILPNKEKGLFAKLIQEYESKKYKIGIKTADQILKKFPEHGETLCMKGLILASLNRQNEGLELAKQGLRYDLTSFISWHALGILNRIVKNYNESIKCYSQALRIEGGTNINLVRESAYLYIQLRDWQKVVENRLTLVRMQPHLRMNWIGLAVALHLGGDTEETLRVLEHFENIHRDVPKRSYEQSEVYLYHAQVLHEAGRHKDAIEYLSKKTSDQVLDVKASSLLQGKCQLALGEVEEAEKTFNGLLQRNNEDRQYIALWLKTKGIDVQSSGQAESNAASAAFKSLQEQFPTSRAIKRMALTLLFGNEFYTQASSYILIALQKGVPSIFNDVRALYVDDTKRDAIENIVEGAREKWTKDPNEAPTSLLWTLYFLAQHYNFLGQYDEALRFIHSAIAHSPTLPELHMTRARIYKKAGAIEWANTAMEDARLLDGQDRSLNCKAAKYSLRAGDISGASKKAGLFTKPDVEDPVLDLVEMQASWYLIEEARAWLAKKNYAMALKRCTQIDKIYTEIWDDQLDFHSYCTRKFTVRAYVDMVRFEDRLHGHHAYFSAATTAIRILLTLHDQPSLLKMENGSAAGNGTSNDGQKKDSKRVRKLEEAAKKNAQAAANGKKEEEDDNAPPKDEDPDGKEAFKAFEPLKDTEKYLTLLQKHASSKIETWLLSFEVALRGKNWLLATKAIARAHALDAGNGQVHHAILRLRKALPILSEAPEPIRESISTVLKSIVPLEEGTLEAYNATFVQRYAGQSAENALASARSALLLRGDNEDGKREAAAILVELAKGAAASHTKVGKTEVKLSILQESIEFLKNECGSTEVGSFVEASKQAYPLADTFKTDSQKEKENIDRENERRRWAFAPPDADGSPAATTNGQN
jgi:N-alpha-acetyltransferase 15/16, NatA auxiliary subunit